MMYLYTAYEQDDDQQCKDISNTAKEIKGKY